MITNTDGLKKDGFIHSQWYGSFLYVDGYRMMMIVVVIVVMMQIEIGSVLCETVRLFHYKPSKQLSVYVSSFGIDHHGTSIGVLSYVWKRRLLFRL